MARFGYHKATFPAGQEHLTNSHLVGLAGARDADGELATAPVHALLREAYIGLGRVMMNNVPEGRERSLALTALQESLMWANAGVAMLAPVDWS